MFFWHAHGGDYSLLNSQTIIGSLRLSLGSLTPTAPPGMAVKHLPKVIVFSSLREIQGNSCLGVWSFSKGEVSSVENEEHTLYFALGCLKCKVLSLVENVRTLPGRQTWANTAPLPVHLEKSLGTLFRRRSEPCFALSEKMPRNFL